MTYDDTSFQNNDSLANPLNSNPLQPGDMQYQDNSTHFGLSGMDQTYDFFDHNQSGSLDFHHQEIVVPQEADSSTYDIGNNDSRSLSFHSCLEDNQSNMAASNNNCENVTNIQNNYYNN